MALTVSRVGLAVNPAVIFPKVLLGMPEIEDSSSMLMPFSFLISLMRLPNSMMLHLLCKVIILCGLCCVKKKSSNNGTKNSEKLLTDSIVGFIIISEIPNLEVLEVRAWKLLIRTCERR